MLFGLQSISRVSRPLRLLLAMLLAGGPFACRNDSGLGPPTNALQEDRKAAVTAVSPVAAKPGDVLHLKGENFDAEPSIQVVIGDARSSVEVNSPTEANFKMPDVTGMGLKQASVVGAAGEIASLQLVADSAGNSLPIIVADASQVCSDITYINAAGEQATGTRDCTGSGVGSVDPYDVRKGKTVSGVAGKLNARCQNTSNLTVHNMSGGSNLRAARVKKITSDGKFILQPISAGVALPVMDNNTFVRPLGITHPILNGDQTLYTGLLRFSTNLIDVDANGNVVTTALNTAAGEIAVRRSGSALTEKFSSTPACDLDANPAVTTNCFTIVVALEAVADVWDTIDDYNAGIAPQVPPDRGTQEAFNTGVCGYLEAPGITVPSYAIPTWRDATRTLAGTASTCADTPTGCTILDLHSGLSWFHGMNTTVNWFEALGYCTNLAIGGMGGWRLPTQKELMSAYINSISRVNSTGTVSNYNKLWWSSTTASHDTASAWWLNLANGDSGWSSKSLAPVGGAVMCVRGP